MFYSGPSGSVVVWLAVCSNLVQVSKWFLLVFYLLSVPSLPWPSTVGLRKRSVSHRKKPLGYFVAHAK